MELFNIFFDLSNIPSKYQTIYEWGGRYFTHIQSAQNAAQNDRVQSGCNVIVEYTKNPKKAKEFNMCGDWYESNSYRAK